MNKVFLIGRIGTEPELKTSSNGESKYTNFTLATTELGTKSKEGKREIYPEWHSLTAFGKTAENVCSYVSKGTLIAVEGRLQTSEYENKDGLSQQKTGIIVSNVEFLQKAKQEKTPKDK